MSVTGQETTRASDQTVGPDCCEEGVAVRSRLAGITGQDIVCHTPGPWETGKGACEIVYAQKRDGQRPRIANCYVAEDSQQAFANARLIAAAPDLLALVKKIAGECAECSGRGYTFSDDGIVGFGPDDREPTREHCAECADIREVIAKAEGRS